jgi:hypothetical protein
VRGPLRLLLVLGLAAIGLFFFRKVPRDVVLVYALESPASVRGVEVDVRSGNAAVRHAEFRFPSGAPERVRHEVKLRDGEYQLDIRLIRDGGRVGRAKASIAVSESGPVVLPLAEVPARAD